ncbi:MAG: M48 family metallopeptidase [Bacteriovoracaceae bacterium]|nr:M48 family metallopeptidase [Bacteriovoracaceae bacterium]
MFNPLNITIVFVCFLVLKLITEIFLEIKNKLYIQSHKLTVPKQFQDKISNEEHQKAANYSTAKINTGLFFLVLNTLIFLGWTLGGGLAFIDQLARNFLWDAQPLGPIMVGVIFFTLFAVISTVIGLPESYYNTFVLEEKFGFNKSTVKLFILDNIKGLILGGVIGLPVAAGILWIMEFLGSWWWAYAWAFLTTVQFIMLFAYPILIAPLFNKFTPLEEGEVKDRIEALLKRIDFCSKGLFVMDASKRSSHGNAYFTGFGKNKRIVFFDTLIKNLLPGEIEAVLAHELGHFKKKHIVKMMIKSLVLSFIGLYILGQLYDLQVFYLGHGATYKSSYMALTLFAMVASTYTFLLTPLFAWFSRKNEFEADRFAAQYSNASDLISALVKLYKDNASTLTPDPLYSAFYHSHPPATTRVNHLEQLASRNLQS